MTEVKRIVILGGYGVFGGHLAQRIINSGQYDVVVAGRSIAKALGFCDTHGGIAAEIDVSGDGFDAALRALSPDIVVDAVGPYQLKRENSFRVARAALECGAHYLDFSDSGAFSKSISELNEIAVSKSRTALSGVSSVPGLSSAIVADLVGDLTDVHKIEGAILPVSRGPRGRGVLVSVLNQVGRPIQIWRGGRWTEIRSWSNAKPLHVGKSGRALLSMRPGSLVNAPDVVLFPDRFPVRSVLFRTGLGMRIMHHGLTALSLPVRWGWISRLTPLTGLLNTAANILERFGPDQGGMTLEVLGRTDDGALVQRKWAVAGFEGEGLQIPTLAAAILIPKLLAGDIKPGARACLMEFGAGEVETALATLNTEIARDETPFEPLVAGVLGDAFHQLPKPIRELHEVLDQRVWEGRASIKRGRNLLSKFAGALVGLPTAADDVPVRVTMTRVGETETWQREFDQHKFLSYMSKAKKDASVLVERFGVMKFKLGLKTAGEQLLFPVKSARVLGIPLPAFLRPKSDTIEYVDEYRRACFRVKISIPICGDVVEYAGWLEDIYQGPTP